MAVFREQENHRDYPERFPSPRHQRLPVTARTAYRSLHNGAYEHASTCWSFRNLFKILKDTTGKSTVQEQIEKLLLDNGVSQQDIDDYRSMMLE